MKRLLIGALALVTIIGILVGVLLFNINPILENLKPELANIVSNATGQPIEIEKIGLTFFPQVGVEIKNAEIIGDASEQIAIKSIILKTNLTSLLRGKIEVKELSISSPTVIIKRDEKGSISIGSINLGDNTTKDTTPKKTPKSSNPETKSQLAIDINKARIKSGYVLFVDNSVSPAQNIEFRNLDLEVSDIHSSGRGQASFAVSILENDSSNENQNVHSHNVALLAKADLANMQLAKATAEIDLKCKNFDLNKISNILLAYGISVPNLSVSNDLSLELAVKIDNGKADTALSLVADNANIILKPSFVKPLGSPLSITIASNSTLDLISLKPDTIDINQATLTLGSNKINMPTTISQDQSILIRPSFNKFSLSELKSFVPVIEQYALSGFVNLDSTVKSNLGALSTADIVGTLGLDSITATIPISTSSSNKNDNTKTGVEISNLTGSFDITNKGITTKNLNLAIEEQSLNLKANTMGLPIPTDLAFVINSEKFLLAPLLTKVAPSLDGFSDSYLSNAQFKGTYSLSEKKGDIRATLGESLIKDVPLTSLTGRISTETHTISIKELKAGIFDGTVDINAMFMPTSKDFGAGISGSQLNMSKVSNIAMKQYPIKISGTMTPLDVMIKGSSKNITQSLSGTINGTIQKGAIEGINIVALALKGITQIPGVEGSLATSLSKEHQQVLLGKDTPFDTFIAEIALGNGKINLKNIKMSHQLFIISGTGWAGFDGTMHINAKLALTKTVALAMVANRPKLELLLDSEKNIVFPVVITKNEGTLLVLPDVTDLLERAAKNTAKKTIERSLDKVTPGLGKALDSLF